jgi:hypothetical protein
MTTDNGDIFTMFTEIKPRKAKFGFKTTVRGDIDALIELGAALNLVKTSVWYDARIRLEVSQGMNVYTINAYTDDSAAADWFRSRFAA